METKKYGIGVIGLFSNVAEFVNLKDAVAVAKKSNVDFIVEFLPDGEKKILSWNYVIEDRTSLEERYIFDGDKRTILSSSLDKQWLVLSKGQPFETILPISEVRHFEKIDA